MRRRRRCREKLFAAHNSYNDNELVKVLYPLVLGWFIKNVCTMNIKLTAW